MITSSMKKTVLAHTGDQTTAVTFSTTSMPTEAMRAPDQLPMPPSALARCLVDMTPAEWYALINSKVFFWFDIERLNRQRRASGISPEAVVMTIDVERLLAAYGSRAHLSPFNTGNARRRPAVRGRLRRGRRL